MYQSGGASISSCSAATAAKRRRSALMLASLVAAALGGTGPASGQATAAQAPAQAASRTDMRGIWTGDQGVLWDTSVRPGERTKAPFTPEYAKIYQEALDLSAKGTPRADPSARCLPPGVPRIMAAPMPFEIVITPEVVYFLHESFSQTRRIFMAGHQPSPYPAPTYNGESLGRWEGDTLFVKTTKIKAEALDTTALPVSDALEVEERYRLLAPDKLEAQITLHDRKAFTRPWTVTRTYTKQPGNRILEYVCNENNRNPVDENGNVGFHGPK